MESAAIVREALASLWPARFDESRLDEATPLGRDGLRLDSIDIVELLLECETRAGRPGYPTEELLAEGAVTVGRLVDHLSTD